METEIGKFVVRTDALFAGDPLYLYDPRRRGQIDRCVPGTWDAQTLLPDTPEGKVLCLVVCHESFPLEREALLDTGRGLPEGFETVRRDVPQDIGACGFFDRILAGEDLESDLGGLADLLDAELPEEPPCGLVLPGGAVASIMRRNGAWSCFVHRNETGQADAAVLRFRWEEIETIIADARNGG